MITLKIFNINRFLEVLNRCRGSVYLVHPDGRKDDLLKTVSIQAELLKKHRENKGLLTLPLIIKDYRDYLLLVCYWIGDC